MDKHTDPQIFVLNRLQCLNLSETSYIVISFNKSLHETTKNKEDRI